MSEKCSWWVGLDLFWNLRRYCCVLDCLEMRIICPNVEDLLLSMAGFWSTLRHHLCGLSKCLQQWERYLRGLSREKRSNVTTKKTAILKSPYRATSTPVTDILSIDFDAWNLNNPHCFLRRKSLELQLVCVPSICIHLVFQYSLLRRLPEDWFPPHYLCTCTDHHNHHTFSGRVSSFCLTSTTRVENWVALKIG